MSEIRASVYCSGAMLASLFFDLFQSSKMQEGFLLGKIEKVVSQSISDTEICTKDTHFNICISSFLPMVGLGSFYSGAGKVDENYLRSALGINFENVVGWYRYRGSCDELYLKERRITQRLKQIFSPTSGLFALGVISGPPCGNSGTMDISYRFNLLSNGSIESIPLVVANMKDTSTSQYIRAESTLPLYSSQALQSILNNLKIFEPAVKEAEKMHSDLLIKLRGLLPKFSETQEKCRECSSEVTRLRALCHSKGIMPEFQPKNNETLSDESIDLMDFETLSPKVKTRSHNESKDRSKPNSSNTDRVTLKKSSARGALKRPSKKTKSIKDGDMKKDDTEEVPGNSITDENSNTVNSGGNEEHSQSPKTNKRKSFQLRPSGQRTPSSISTKDKEAHVARSSSCDSSPPKNKTLTNQSPVKTGEKSLYTGKIKSARMQNRSLERCSPIRHRSPSKSSREIKSKVKECWTNSSKM